MENNKEILAAEDELSLFQIILNLLNEFNLWILIIKKNLKIFYIVAILGGFIGLTYSYKSVPTYNANLTFLMGSNGPSNFMNSLSSLSSFLPGGIGSLGNSTERVANIIKSDNILFNSLFEMVLI